MSIPKFLTPDDDTVAMTSGHSDPFDALAAEIESFVQHIPPPAPLPLRVQYLREGEALTNGDRNAQYGDPLLNFRCAGELKAIIRRYLARPMDPGELEALDMVLTKISRVITGSPKADTYVDGATYFAIAGECAARSGEPLL